MEKAGHVINWSDIKQDLEALQETVTVIEENDRRLTVRSQCARTCGKAFQAVGAAVPPTIREV